MWCVRPHGAVWWGEEWSLHVVPTWARGSDTLLVTCP